MYKLLIDKAKEALKNSYSPYSDFKVGAAILTEDGEIFTGSNVENITFGATVCAERAAAVKAVNNGKRKFKAIAVVSQKGSFCMPCGICRQFLCEFSPEMIVIAANPDGDYKEFVLKDLIPEFFNDIK